MFPSTYTPFIPSMGSIPEEPLHVPHERKPVQKNATKNTEIIGNTIIFNGERIIGMTTSQNIHITECSAGNLKSEKGWITALNCIKLGALSTTGKITLIDCPDVSSAWTTSSVELKNSIVNFSVRAQGNAEITDSKIRELFYTISPGNPSPVIKNCVIGTLHLKRDYKKNNINPDSKFVVSPKDTKIIDIELVDCEVGRLIVEDGVKERVVLIGKSKVVNAPEGIVR